MKYVQALSSETVKMLERLYRQSQHHRVRQRAHCILMSSQGFRMAQLMVMFEVSRKTIYNWLTAWETGKLIGLYDEVGRGRKPTFTSVQQAEIRAWVKAEPRNLKLVLNKIKEKWGIKVSKDTVKRVLKSLGMTWRRIRKVVAGTPDEQDYQDKCQHLEDLKRLDERGEIDLHYFDETGFCLVPYVPYAWQDKEETIALSSQLSQRLNVLGLMTRSNNLYVYVFEGRITSDIVIAYLDKFSDTLHKRTVVVLDQASIHTSKAVEDKCQEWQQKQLELFWLPPYSPQLNLIEILWRFIKYQWLPFEAYQDWNSLVQSVETVLKEVGSEYVINFA